MLQLFIQWLLTSPTWWLRCWLLCLLAAFSLSCAPAIWMFSDVALPPAYELKGNDPFADTSTLTIPEHEGERSHGAKLTPRLGGSIALAVTTRLGVHPYWPASFGGAIVLLSAIVTGYRVSGTASNRDRSIGLLAGLLVSGLYVVNGCFSMNHGPKPFDGVALGMIGIVMLLIDAPVLMGMAAFLACWTDERAMVSLALIAMIQWVRPIEPDSSHRGVLIALSSSVVAYAVSRPIVASWAGWQSADLSLLGDQLLATVSYTQMAAWSAFEGGWILVAACLWLAGVDNTRKQAVVLLLAAIATTLSCLIVLDISRASAFGFPLVFAMIGLLAKSLRPGSSVLRDTVGYAALVSLLASNVEIINSIAYSPLPNTLIVLWLRWFS